MRKSMMYKRVSGESVNDKFDSINKHLNVLYKKSGQYVIGALPPIPVFDYITYPESDTGVVLRRMFPGPGKITKGAMYIEQYLDKGNITIEVEVFGPLGGSNVKFPTRQQMITITPNLSVDAGFRVVVSVNPPELVKGIWTAFLYEVDWNTSVKEQFLLDELLALVEKNSAEENGAEAEEAGEEEGS